jgi:hypothetical protein
MDDKLTKQRLEQKLARCLELASEYAHGSTAELIRDTEDEVREQLRALKSKPAQT